MDELRDLYDEFCKTGDAKVLHTIFLMFCEKYENGELRGLRKIDCTSMAAPIEGSDTYEFTHYGEKDGKKYTDVRMELGNQVHTIMFVRLQDGKGYFSFWNKSDPTIGRELIL